MIDSNLLADLIDSNLLADQSLTFNVSDWSVGELNWIEQWEGNGMGGAGRRKGVLGGREATSCLIGGVESNRLVA